MQNSPNAPKFYISRRRAKLYDKFFRRKKFFWRAKLVLRVTDEWPSDEEINSGLICQQGKLSLYSYCSLLLKLYTGSFQQNKAQTKVKKPCPRPVANLINILRS